MLRRLMRSISNEKKTMSPKKCTYHVAFMNMIVIEWIDLY
jgi:hypothetical protein